MKNRWYLRALALLLVSAAAAFTFVSAAEAGSSKDPLVTLSYLNETFLPRLLSQVEQKSGGGGGVFEVVSVPKGRSLTLGVGAEVLLRGGTATCVAASAPGLIDETSGGSLDGGGALVQNHLYMATAEGRGLKASADVRAMVRGTYSVA